MLKIAKSIAMYRSSEVGYVTIMYLSTSNIWASLQFYMINNDFLMDCGNIVEISMQTIDEVNAKRKLKIMDATTVFGFVFGRFISVYSCNLLFISL